MSTCPGEPPVGYRIAGSAGETDGTTIRTLWWASRRGVASEDLVGEEAMTARIMVAEDDPKQANLIKLYLERQGHNVVTVGDGRAALDACRERRPDLLVLDVMMPKVNGLDVCRVLRTESDMPILLVTARSTEDDLLLGLDVGADDYITKPYSPR